MIELNERPKTYRMFFKSMYNEVEAHTDRMTKKSQKQKQIM